MLKIPRALGTLVCIGALLLGSACSAGSGGSSGGGQPGQLSVVTSFYPLQFLAERIAGPHAAVENLTPAGSEPHDLELTPKQVGSLSQADLLVYERTFQAAVDQAVDNAGDVPSLDTTTVVPLEKTGADHDHEGEDGEGHEGDGHDHGENDPHVWLDPTRMVTIAEALTAQLKQLDADHADDYDANLTTLRSELTTLDKEFSSGLADCDRTEFITSHAAFGYLAKRYHLAQIGISGLSPDAEPSPARIAEIHAEAEEHGITTIFYETLVSPDVAKSIAGDLGLRTDVLDPLEGITDQSKGEDYLAVMRSNLAALQTANGCQ